VFGSNAPDGIGINETLFASTSVHCTTLLTNVNAPALHKTFISEDPTKLAQQAPKDAIRRSA